MKKILSLFAVGLFLMAIAVSCKKDDPAATNALLGSWTFTSAAATGCTDAGNNFVETCTTDCGVLTFTATGFTFTQPGTTTETGTYTISGSTITSTKTGSTANVSTFSVVGTILSLVEVKAATNCTETTTFTKV